MKQTKLRQVETLWVFFRGRGKGDNWASSPYLVSREMNWGQETSVPCPMFLDISQPGEGVRLCGWKERALSISRQLQPLGG